MLLENFQISRPVGAGHSRPNDVIRLRKALRETGHGASPPDPSGVYDSSLNSTIKRFQRDYGLEPDGVVTPDSPTAHMLDLALTAQRQGGDESQAQFRQMVSAIGDAGLKPQAPPPGDPRPIVFADAHSRFASSDRILNIVRRSSNRPAGRRPGEVQVAFAPAIPAAIVAGEAAWEAAAALLGIGIGVAGAAKVNEAIKNKAPTNQKAIPEQRGPNDANGAQRTIDTKADTSILPGGSSPPNLPPHIPTPPLTHPPVPHSGEPETVPIVEGGPQILPGPPIEPAKPQKMIYEVLPDNEFWRRLSILERAGNDNTRMLNHRVAERAVEIAKELGVKLNVIFGGYDENGKYRPEGYMRPKGDLRVPNRPTLNSSYLDIGLEDEASKTKIYINTTDNYANGELKPREAGQVHKVNINKETGDMFTTVPKPRGKDVGLEEYVKQFDDLLREVIKRLKR